jgi:type II secretory pathway component GspD/PulD (secretin)
MLRTPPVGDGRTMAGRVRSLGLLVVLLAAAVSLVARPARASAQQTEARRIAVAWEAAPLTDVLTAFAEYSGASIVAGSGVDGFVTATIQDQPWDVALEAILTSLGLYAVEEESGIIRVMSMTDAFAREEIEPIVTRSYRLSYLEASEVQAALAPLLTPRGSVSILESTNTVIVSDIARVQRTVADLLQ